MTKENTNLLNDVCNVSLSALVSVKDFLFIDTSSSCVGRNSSCTSCIQPYTYKESQKKAHFGKQCSEGETRRREARKRDMNTQRGCKSESESEREWNMKWEKRKKRGGEVPTQIK